jgi:hypothetical protein
VFLFTTTITITGPRRLWREAAGPVKHWELVGGRKTSTREGERDGRAHAHRDAHTESLYRGQGSVCGLGGWAVSDSRVSFRLYIRVFVCE